MGRLVRRMSDHHFTAALHGAQYDGNGEAVAGIWREIADGKMSDADTLAWAKTVSEWIGSANERSQGLSDGPASQALTTQPSDPISRVARIHAALAVAGWTEPALDSPADADADDDDDHDDSDPDGLAYDLMKAIGHKSERLTAEKIWRAIANGEAHDYTKLTWVEHVASELVVELIDNASLNDRLRGFQALNATGLWGITDTYAELRSYIDMVADFREIAGLEKVAPARTQIVRFMQSQGLIEAGVSKSAAGKRADRQIAIVMADRPKKQP
jgi:hypothetical protein